MTFLITLAILFFIGFAVVYLLSESEVAQTGCMAVLAIGAFVSIGALTLFFLGLGAACTSIVF